ncbi:MAG: T9SS type A sorting domain-containing protein, partial [Bacteroidota bacterium]
DPAYVSYFESRVDKAGEVGRVASEILPGSYRAAGRKADAIQAVRALQEKYSGSESEKRALIFVAALMGNKEEERDIKKDCIAQLKAKFGSTCDAGILAALGTDNSESKAVAGPEEEAGELSNYPNPFNPTTVISYKLIAVSNVSLRIFDILGREVAVLVNESKNPGRYSVTWDASKLPSGVYFSKLEVAGKSIIRKLLLIK